MNVSNYLLQNYTVTDQVQKVAEAFQCKPVEGNHLCLFSDVSCSFGLKLFNCHVLLIGLIPDISQGMLSHQLKRNVIDGEKAIIQNPTEQQR